MFKLSRLALVAIFATSTLYAASNHSSRVNLNTDIRAGATSIPAGDYTLHWTVDSGDTNLTISGGTRPYSIPVTVKPNSARQTGGAAVLSHSDGKTEVLDGFQVKDALLILR